MTPTAVKPVKARSRIGGRKPKNFPQGRRCVHPDCDTLLSIYNRSETCHLHKPLRYPRQRGRSRLGA